jgi:hypothetical protein
LVDDGRRGRLKLRLLRRKPTKPQLDAPPRRIVGGSRLDPSRIEAARERLRREIPPRPADE